MDQLQKISEATEFIKSQITGTPDVALVLGSGLGDFVQQVKVLKTWKFHEIPHFPAATVIGHKGQLVWAECNGKHLLIAQGRIHFYEGHSLFEVTLMVRVFGQLGIKNLILTNAAGGMGPGYKAGDFMIIKDQINLTGMNALIGPNLDHFGPRFPDMSEAYSEKLREHLHRTFKKVNIPFHEGIYGGLLGPTYETPAEVRYLQKIGCDAVGMSTVQECIVARHMQMQVAGISLISNLASGLGTQSLTHQEVTEMAAQKAQDFVKVVKTFITDTF